MNYVDLLMFLEFLFGTNIKIYEKKKQINRLHKSKSLISSFLTSMAQFKTFLDNAIKHPLYVSSEFGSRKI